MELFVFMMHLLGFKQRLLLQSCCEPLRNSTKQVAKLLRYRCETVAKALRGCRETLAMLSRRRHEAAARLLRIGSKMITVFLRSCGEAVEHVAKSLWRDREVAKMFDAVAMLLRSRYWLLECWLRSREACSEAVPMRRCSVVHAKP